MPRAPTSALPTTTSQHKATSPTQRSKGSFHNWLACSQRVTLCACGYQGITRPLLGHYQSVTRALPERFQGITRAVSGQYQGITSRAFLGHHQGIIRALPGHYKSSTRAFPGHLQGTTRAFPGHYRGITRAFDLNGCNWEPGQGIMGKGGSKVKMSYNGSKKRF